MNDPVLSTRKTFRLRYSLRGLMMVVTLTACMLGWLSWQRRAYQRELAVCALLENKFGSRIATDYELAAGAESGRPELRLEELWHGRIYYPVQGVGCFDTPLDREAWEAIGSLHHINELLLTCCEIRTDEKTFSRLPSLRRLEVTVDALSNTDLREINSLKQLRELTLARPDHSAPADTTTTAWTESLSPLRELQILNLKNLPISANAIKIIANMKELRTLSLVNCCIDPTELRQLERLDKLELLRLSDVPIDDDVLRAWTKLRKLNYVVLDRCSISDAALNSLAELPELAYLSVRDAPITDDGLKQLMKLPKIRELKLTGTPLTRRSLETLKSMRSLNWSQIDFPEQLRYTGTKPEDE